MTNLTAHTTAALLNTAVAALENVNRTHKKETGAALFALGTDMGHGITFRELKAWAKEFKAKQAEVALGGKANDKAEAKPNGKAGDAKPVAPKAANTFTNVELKDSELLIGRVKDKIVRVVKDKETEARIAVTANGLRIPVEMIERNNRGNLRTVAEYAAKPAANVPAPKAAAAAPVKPAAPKAANKAEPVALKAAEIKDQIVLIGRAKEKVIRVVRDTKRDIRVAVTEEGSRIDFDSIERNNRGNLRVKPGLEEKVWKAAPKNAAPVKAGLRVLDIGKSSNIAGASYDKARKTLIVTFKSGSVYEYAKVTLAEIKELEAAESKGSHFSKVIKPAKDGVCIVKAPKADKAA